jgi:copper resistance protein D
VNDALVIARLVQFAAAMAAFGASAFRFYAVGWLSSAPDERIIARFDLWNRALLWISGLIMLLSGIAIVPFVAARMAGEESAAVDPATIETVLSATAFGHRWCWHLLFTLLLIVSAVIVRRRHALNLLWAALALASLGWVGHAAGASGWVGLGRELNQSVHLLAAGLWLGGLLPLGWLLGRVRSGAEGFGAFGRHALPAFSQMGYAAVAAIATTGIVNTLILVGSVDALYETDYGQLLSLKILLYLAMIAVAIRNRFRLVPRLADKNGTAGSALYRSVLMEQAIGLGILAAVSLLGTWAPPFMHHH